MCRGLLSSHHHAMFAEFCLCLRYSFILFYVNSEQHGCHDTCQDLAIFSFFSVFLAHMSSVLSCRCAATVVSWGRRLMNRVYPAIITCLLGTGVAKFPGPAVQMKPRATRLHPHSKPNVGGKPKHKPLVALMYVIKKNHVQWSALCWKILS